MNKIAYTIALSASLVIGSLAITGCNNNTESKTETQETTEMAEATYACPMDCEKGKTYSEPGTCPVCEMDLKNVEH